jgi:hypothetical protein
VTAFRDAALIAAACLLMRIAVPIYAQDASAIDPAAPATTTEAPRPIFEIYGFVEADAIADFDQNNPDWFDSNRPTKLPAFSHEFGQDGHFYLSPRQSRFGVASTFPTPSGDVTATFEFDMVGTGSDAGITTIRLRHAWGQWKQIGGGQTYSEFMDADVYPNRLDVWGPNGMPTSRNPQIFWEPYRNGDSNLRIAIENPGATADGGIFANWLELQHVKPRSPMPDFTGHYRRAAAWGYIQVGSVVEYIAYDDLLAHDPFNVSGHAWGWGGSLSSNVHVGANDLLRLQAVYGHAIENYLNDAPIDVGVKLNPSNSPAPIVGEALPVFSMVAYLEHNWTKGWSTSAGYSRVDVRNSSGQAPSAFRLGQYATANLLCTPAENFTIGGELQWAQRRNFSDGWTANDYRLEFSLKYTFSYKLRG